MEPISVKAFLELVRRALTERSDVEHCIYDRNMWGHMFLRPNPRLHVYACAVHWDFYGGTYRLFVVPGAVVFHNISIRGEYCETLNSYNSVRRYVKEKPYKLYAFRKPARYPDASTACTD